MDLTLGAICVCLEVDSVSKKTAAPWAYPDSDPDRMSASDSNIDPRGGSGRKTDGRLLPCLGGLAGLSGEGYPGREINDD